jgi:hypothetical protein
MNIYPYKTNLGINQILQNTICAYTINRDVKALFIGTYLINYKKIYLYKKIDLLFKIIIRLACFFLYKYNLYYKALSDKIGCLTGDIFKDLICQFSRRHNTQIYDLDEDRQ